MEAGRGGLVVLVALPLVTSEQHAGAVHGDKRGVDEDWNNRLALGIVLSAVDLKLANGADAGQGQVADNTRIRGDVAIGAAGAAVAKEFDFAVHAHSLSAGPDRRTIGRMDILIRAGLVLHLVGYLVLIIGRFFLVMMLPYIFSSKEDQAKFDKYFADGGKLLEGDPWE